MISREWGHWMNLPPPRLPLVWVTTAAKLGSSWCFSISWKMGFQKIQPCSLANSVFSLLECQQALGVFCCLRICHVPWCSRDLRGSEVMWQITAAFNNHNSTMSFCGKRTFPRQKQLPFCGSEEGCEDSSRGDTAWKLLHNKVDLWNSWLLTIPSEFPSRMKVIHW